MGGSPTQSNNRLYTIASTGNATDFGDLNQIVSTAGCIIKSSTTRIVKGGGYQSTNVLLEYVDYSTQLQEMQLILEI